MAAATWVRRLGGRELPGGRDQGRVTAAGARRVGGRPAGAGALPELRPLAAMLAIGSGVGLGGWLGLEVPAAPLAGATAHAKTITLSTAKVPHVGTVLTTGAGLTLYRFMEDPAGMATCTGVCAKAWPPLLVAKGTHVQGPHGVKGLSVIAVGGGHWQVALDDHALYRFAADKKKGQAKGQGLVNEWFAALKSGIPATAAGTAAVAPTTTTTTTTGAAPGSTPTQPMTSTTQGPHSSTPPTSPAPAPAPMPAAQTPAPVPPPPPPTTPTAPPTTTPTTQPPPPTTTPTTSPGGGGYGY
jgi:predicted lipoprotein with Yx(FWY)xxD motif